jgi:nitrate reductase gamma subunit
MIDSMEFLLWTKGPMFQIAIAVFAVGILARLFEIFALGRRHNYAEPRGGELIPGLKTVYGRFNPDPGTFKRSPFDVIVGMIWHIGFIVALLLFIPHVELIQSTLGIGWPALPNPVVDAITAITLVGLVAALIHRLTQPVKRFLSTPEDYLIWLVTFLPVLTGYFAYHRLINPYPLALGIHILAAEVFLIVLPFTKLTHIFTAFVARWYNGAIFGRKGVQS